MLSLNDVQYLLLWPLALAAQSRDQLNIFIQTRSNCGCFGNKAQRNQNKNHQNVHTTQRDWALSREWMVTQLIMASHNEQWQWISTGVYLKSTLNHGLELLPLMTAMHKSAQMTFPIVNVRYAVVLVRVHLFILFLFFFGNNKSLSVSYFGSFVTHSHTRTAAQQREEEKTTDVWCAFYLGVYYIRWKFCFIWTLFWFLCALSLCVCAPSLTLNLRLTICDFFREYFLDARHFLIKDRNVCVYFPFAMSKRWMPLSCMECKCWWSSPFQHICCNSTRILWLFIVTLNSLHLCRFTLGFAWFGLT